MKKIMMGKVTVERTTIQAYGCTCTCGNYCSCHCDGSKLDSVDNRIPGGASLTSSVSTSRYVGK